MNVLLSMHYHGRDSQYQKLLKSFCKCFSINRQNDILVQNLVFLSAGIFQIAFHFKAGIRPYRPADGGKKGQGLFLTSK